MLGTLLWCCAEIAANILEYQFQDTRHQTIEVSSLIAAYRANYDSLKSTKSGHGKKSVWDSIMEDFLSLCSDAGIESEKTLAQIKEKWRSLFDKYKAAKDHNNKTGRDRKTFEFFFMTSTNSCQGPTRSTLNSSRKRE